VADAVKHAAARLYEAVRPVLLGGARLRAFGARDAFPAVAEAGGYGVVTMPDGKSFLPERHPNYLGSIGDRSARRAVRRSSNPPSCASPPAHGSPTTRPSAMPA